MSLREKRLVTLLGYIFGIGRFHFCSFPEIRITCTYMVEIKLNVIS